VSSFGPQPFANKSTTIMPNNCTSGWTCEYDWINVITTNPSGTPLSAAIVSGSSDDAGNLVTGKTKQAFYYDKDPPQIINIVNSSVCPAAPGTIDITINVSEKYSGGVKAIYSAPNLSTAVFPETEDCEETEDVGIWTCDISIDKLVTIYASDYINLTLEDRAGNNFRRSLAPWGRGQDEG